MIQSTHRYVLPLLRTWTTLSQQCLRWLNRPSELGISTHQGASPSQDGSPDQALQEASGQGEWLDPLDKHPQEVHIRSLVVRCQGLTAQYQATPEVIMERWWWRALHQAGVRLRDTLAETLAYQQALSLTREEWDQAYFLLIHVAYFFEPGGVVEEVCQEQGWSREAQEFERF